MIPSREKPVAKQATARRFARWLSLVYGMVLGLGGISLPFFPVWLRATGIDISWIGVVTALPSFTRFTILPFVTAFAERSNRLRAMIIACAFLTAVGFVAVGMNASLWPILLLYGLTACVWTPILPMVEGYALKGVVRHGIEYGPVRLWGSAAFIAGAVLCGVLIEWLSPVHLIWIMAAMALGGALASLGLVPLDGTAATKIATAPDRHLLRSPGFLALVASAALIQGSHATYYSYGSIVWQQAGLSGVTISLLWSIGVVAEIIVFAVSPRFTWPPIALMGIGAASAMVRWTITAQQPPLAILAVVQAMHCLTYGMTQLGTVGLMLHLVPTRQMATAQGYLVAISGVVLGLAYVVTGPLFARFGHSTYYAMVGMGAAGGLVLLAARSALSGPQVQPQSAETGGETELP